MAHGQESTQGTKGMAERVKETGGQALQKADQMVSAPMRAQEAVPSKMYLAAVAGSILASLGLMLAGRSQGAIFVGLWAPTIMNMGLFYKLLRPSEESMLRQGQGYRAPGYGAPEGYTTAAGPRGSEAGR